MIDPTTITNFNASDHELQELLLFWIYAAGKNGKVAARLLDKLLSRLVHRGQLPFCVLRAIDHDRLCLELKSSGIGCQQTKARAMIAAAQSSFDLRSCSVEDLQSLPGIGPKTARCFILHSRKDAQVAALDTHILKFLRSKGIDAPKATPASKKQYDRLEQEFLKLARQARKPPAVFDLEIWNSYAH